MLILLLSGCSNNALFEAEEMINELQETINDLESTVSDLESEIEGREIAIFDLENEIEGRAKTTAVLESTIEGGEEVISSLENEILSMQPYRFGWQNIVVLNLIENFESLNLEEFLGENPITPTVDDIALISGNNVFITVGWESSWPPIGVVLSFQREDEYVNWDHAILSWEVVGYTTGDGLRFISDRKRNTDRLTDSETVAVRFYYYEEGYIHRQGLEEGLHYISEEIAGEQLRDEFIRLMSDHAEIEIWDLWYEGSILYVDLMPVERGRFRGGGCGSSAHNRIQSRHHQLIRTLSSFSDAQTIHVLIGGERDAMIDDRAIGGTFNRRERPE